MPSLDSTTVREIVDLLTPLMQREDERRALLTLALGQDAAVFRRLHFGGGVEPFILNIVTDLAAFGEIEPGRQALWALLEVARDRVGVDRQARIDALRPVVNAVSRNGDQGPVTLSDDRANTLNWETLLKLITAVVVLITAVIGLLKYCAESPPKPSPPIEVSYLYRAAGQGELRTLAAGAELRSGDHYKIWFTPAHNGYVYVFQIDSSQAIHRLFPLESFQGVAVHQTNPVRAGRQYPLPADDKAFVLDDQVGQEQIYALAFPEPNADLERLYEALEQARQQRNTARITDLQTSLLEKLKAVAPAKGSALTFVHLERR